MVNGQMLPTDNSSLDRDAALARVGGDTDLLREIAVLFIEDYPKVLTELREAIARGDANQVERTAHGLKGSVSTFGARAAMEAALKIETMGRARQITGVEQVMNTLEIALAALRLELERL
jgi:HPt (histidine-containing phosphotransfer) domain-containing protein